MRFFSIGRYLWELVLSVLVPWKVHGTASDNHADGDSDPKVSGSGSGEAISNRTIKSDRFLNSLVSQSSHVPVSASNGNLNGEAVPEMSSDDRHEVSQADHSGTSAPDHGEVGDSFEHGQETTNSSESHYDSGVEQPLRRILNFIMWEECRVASGKASEGRERQIRDEENRRSDLEMWKIHRDTILASLQRTMDPVVAAAMYNEQFSPIYKLPDEVLLRVFHHLSVTMTAFFCARQVSRRFRRLVSDRTLRGHMFSSYHDCNACLGQDFNCVGVPGGPLKQFHHRPSHTFRQVWWRLLRGLGDEESILHEIWYKVLGEIGDSIRLDTWCAKCRDSRRWRQHIGLSTVCKFSALEYDYLHCSGCDIDHPAAMFSARQKQRPWFDRSCIGREGFVRLCEHVVITWTDVEAFITQCRRSPTGEYRPRIAFLKRCTHPSHSADCRSTPKMMPVAQAYFWENGRVDLELRWEAHRTLPDSSVDSETGQISSLGLRAMIQANRDQARYIAPEESPGQLPEMECYGLQACDCLHYDGGRRKASVTPCELKDHRSACNAFYPWSVTLRRCNSRLSPSSSSSDPCYATQYRRFMTGEVTPSRPGIEVPIHEWYHALDRDSCKFDGVCGAKEACSDPACSNYYASFQPKRCGPAFLSRGRTGRKCDSDCLLRGGVPRHLHPTLSSWGLGG